ncbi:MAG: hypothetical protein JHD33_00785 [Chthoniobacterales bacterium]|nr:hypothetical protein [Chthoniobacterales bacterium]
MKAIRILVVVALLAAGAGGAAYLLREDIVNWWLQRKLAGELSRRFGAQVEMEGVRYRDGILSTQRCRVSGGRTPFASLEIKDARLPIGLDRLENPAGEPLRLEAGTVDLVWRDQPPAPAATAGPREGTAGEVRADTAMPVVEMAAGNFSFRHEDAARWRMANSTVHGSFEAGKWSFSGRGGTMAAPGWPEFRIEKITGEHSGKETRISDFVLNDPKGGTITGAGAALEGRWSGDFRWNNIGMEFVLPPAAMNHFQGRSGGEARLARDVLTGRMQLEGAEVRNLPALVKLASIFTGENYGTVAWESVSFDFIRDARGAVLIENLAAVSSKGLAVQGAGAFAQDHLSADLQLGLKREGRPWLVAFMPILFRREKDGYLWMPIKVGGTPHAPTEDLTPRVVLALAVVPATQAADTAAELPANAVEAAGGLLRSLFGR